VVEVASRRHRTQLLAATAVLVAVAVILTLASPAPGAGRERLDIRVFARVPEPGQPEPVAIGPRRRVFVGTNQQGKGDAEAPSKVFVYSRRGRLKRDIELRRQDLSADHGIQGLAFDSRHRLYVLDRSASPRVVRINLRTGRQRDYAAFRDVPPCSEPGQRGCSATVNDAAAVPDYPAFDRRGRLYVTDLEQALIWRIPKGGGRPRVWLTDAQLESIFGPNGIQFISPRTILFASTAMSPATGDPTSGGLFKVRVRRDGRPGRLQPFWSSRPFDGPDGLAVGRSGRVYVALAGANQILVLSPRGAELARVPATPLENQMLDVPLDGPASLAFLGRRLLMTNQTDPLAGSGNPAHWVVFDVFAGERGLPLYRP
jgi:sugar lactone lactonase YvrE